MNPPEPLSAVAAGLRCSGTTRHTRLQLTLLWGWYVEASCFITEQRKPANKKRVYSTLPLKAAPKDKCQSDLASWRNETAARKPGHTQVFMDYSNQDSLKLTPALKVPFVLGGCTAFLEVLNSLLPRAVAADFQVLL